MTPMGRTNTATRRKRRKRIEFHRQSTGAGNAAAATEGLSASLPGAEGYPVRRVPLLARHPLYDLFPGAAAPSGWEQGVTRWAIGS